MILPVIDSNEGKFLQQILRKLSLMSFWSNSAKDYQFDMQWGSFSIPAQRVFIGSEIGLGMKLFCGRTGLRSPEKPIALSPLLKR